MDSGQRFNETLPDKKEIYSILTMENITDARAYSRTIECCPLLRKLYKALF